MLCVSSLWNFPKIVRFSFSGHLEFSISLKSRRIGYLNSRPQISLLRRSDFLDALQNYFSYYLCDDRKHGDITPSVALKTTAFHGNLNNQPLLAFSGKDIRLPVKSHGELLPRLQLFIVVDDESTGKSFTTIKRFATNFQFFHYAIYGSKIIVLCGSFHFPDLCNNKFFHDSTVSPILWHPLGTWSTTCTLPEKKAFLMVTHQYPQASYSGQQSSFPTVDWQLDRIGPMLNLGRSQLFNPAETTGQNMQAKSSDR